MENYYQTLGLSADANVAVIKASYRALCKLYHPDIYEGDKTYATSMMQKINQAYEILSNPSKRSEYDRAWGESSKYSSTQKNNEKYEKNTHLEKEWDFAIGYYPNLSSFFNDLSLISPSLAYSFKVLIVESKDYSDPQRVSDELEDMYFKKYFGNNELIRRAAKKYILGGQREAAAELNKAANAFGSNIDPSIVLSKVSKKFSRTPEKNQRQRGADNFSSKYEQKEKNKFSGAHDGAVDVKKEQDYHNYGRPDLNFINIQPSHFILFGIIIFVVLVLST